MLLKEIDTSMKNPQSVILTFYNKRGLHCDM